MDSPRISDQFDEWYMTEYDFPDITIKHVKVLSCRNNSKQIETMFLVYEYDYQADDPKSTAP
jgi:hypothetical protein